VPLGAEPNIWLDYDGLSAFFRQNQNDTRFFRLDPTAQYRDDFQGDFTIRERILAAYGMGQVHAGRFTLTGGVRVERTSVDSSAFTMGEQGSTLSARPVTGAGSYTTVLPSGIVTAAIRQDLVARAGWSRTLGRPEFDAIAPRSVLAIREDPVIGTIGALSIGNPDLKARESNNIDLSLEWYFAEGSILSAAFFRKDITNEIIPAPTQRLTNHTFQGQTYDRFEINTTVNAEDAFVQGMEFTLAHRLGFLPPPFNGLGFGASLTLIDSGIKVARGDEVLVLPLLQQADTSASATMYYQRGRFDLSGTYKYNANFLTDYGSSRALDLDQGSFGRFDVRAQFDLTRDVKLVFTGINLNDEPTSEFQGGNPRQNTEYEYT
jgi:TonB-dependent receptor